MKIIIKNATLISMSEKRKKIEENIDIEVIDSKITKIAKNIQTLDADKVIDGTGKVVMPGLINTHAHVPMSIFRETVDGYNLQDWLTKKIWPMEDKLTNEDIYYASYLSFIEMIKTGTTTINDMYFMTEDIIKAAIECGIRLQTTRTLMDAGSKELGEERLSELKELVKKYKNYNECISLNVGIHGLYTSSREYVQKCIKFAKENELPLHMHFCENAKEVQDIKEAYNEAPIDISHCPVSNLKLGCGIANISYMQEQGITVTLGTDGQGSGSNLDLFESMKYTALLQKGIKENPVEMPAYEVLKLATINGAKALGLENKIGSIEESKQADLIILNLDTAVTKPVNDIVSDIVYNVKGNNVETTIVNGKILMKNKQLKINENDIYNKCKQIIERIQE